MSKRLEEEYRQMVNDQVPDLWNRIEAGLKEKNSPPVQAVKAAAKPKKKVIFRIIPWAGGVAAAALIFILVIPAIVSMTRKGNTKTASAEMFNANGAAYEMAENAMAETTDAVDDVEYDPRDFTAGATQEGAKADGTDSYPTGDQKYKATLSPETIQQGIAAEEDSKIQYARVIGFTTDGSSEESTVTLKLYIGTDYSEVAKESNKDKLLFKEKELSPESPLKPEQGKIYRMEEDESGVLLMEEVSAENE